MLRLSLALPTPMLESPSPTVNNPIASISMATHWLPFHHLKDANVWFRVSIHYLAPKLSETSKSWEAEAMTVSCAATSVPGEDRQLVFTAIKRWKHTGTGT